MPDIKIASFLNRNRWIPWGILVALSIALIVLGISLYSPTKTEILTQDERNWLIKNSPIVMSSYTDHPPLDFIDANGTHAGMMPDYIKLLGKKLNTRFVYKDYASWEETLAALNNGEIDGISAVPPLLANASGLVYTRPIFSIPQVIVTRVNVINRLSMVDLDGWSVAIANGNPVMDDISKANANIKIIQVPSDLIALEEVSTERADATILSMAVATYLIQDQAITNLRISGNVVTDHTDSIAVSSENPILAAIIYKGVDAVTTEELDTIFKKWVGLHDTDTISNSDFRSTVFWILLSVAILIGTALIWTNALQAKVNAQTASINNELSERRKTETQLSQQLQNLSALRAVSGAINASMDLPLTLNILLDQVSSKLQIDACDVLLLNNFTRTLDYAADRGFRTSFIKNTNLSYRHSFAWDAVQTRRVVFIENLQEQPGALANSPLHRDESFVSYLGAPLISKGTVKGVLEIFHRTPLIRDPSWIEFLEAMANQAAIAIDNASLFQDLQRANMDISLAYDATIEGWARALEMRDGATEGHSQRVTNLALSLASRMGINDEDLVHIRRGSLLHDIGKMGIPDNILLKPGPLSADEWEIMRMHPTFAHNFLKDVTHLHAAIDIPHYHHEKWDGTGYPKKLKGEQIPLSARIFAVIDVWDALTSDRPYRKAWNEEEALEYIRENVGTQFDPDVVRDFLLLMRNQSSMESIA